MGMSFDAASETDGRWQGFRRPTPREIRSAPNALFGFQIVQQRDRLSGDIVSRALDVISYLTDRCIRSLTLAMSILAR